MFKKYRSIILLLGVLAILLSASPVFAHLMLIEPVEEGRVRVAFDDGSANRHAEVVVYDENENEIARGDVDGEGYFNYDPQEAELLVADDGFGHRAEYVAGEETQQALQRGPVVAGVLFGFAFIAGLFQYRIQKKNSNVQEESGN